MLKTIYRGIIYPVCELLFGRNFWSLEREFERIEKLPFRQLKDRTERKLRKLISHAYQNVPFYKKRFDEFGIKPQDIKTIEDLSKLPITTKEDLRRNFPNDTTAKNISKHRRILDATSGSTGEPLMFFRDKRSQDYQTASYLLFKHWASLDPGDKWIHFGMPSKSRLEKLIFDLIDRRHSISVLDLSNNVDKFIKKIIKMKVRALEGYASALFFLASRIKQSGLHFDNLKAVISTSETLYAPNIIRQAFNAPIFNRYGNREMGGSLAQSCSESCGLHVNTEVVILEVIGKDGRGCSPSEKGII